MALNVAWRWSTPQIGDPSTVAKQNQQGFENFAEGLGQMIGGIRQERREDAQRRQAQANWQATFDQAKANADQTQANWQKTYEMQKAIQDFNMNRQKIQDEWLQKFYDQYFGDDDEYEELKQLRAKFGNQGGPSELELILAGLNPSLR